MGDPRVTDVDRVGSFGASAGGAVVGLELPVLFLVQVRVLSGGGARWSSVVARLLPWHPRIGGSAPCVDPRPDPVWRSPCWRRIRWMELKAGHARWLFSASTVKTVAARWRSWDGRVLAVLVQRHKFRRSAADEPCGDLQQERYSRCAVRRRTAAFVVDAGVVAVVCSGLVSPTYAVLLFVSVLRPLYVVFC